MQFSKNLSEEELFYIKTLINNNKAIIIEDGENIPDGITHEIIIDEKGVIIGIKRMRFDNIIKFL